MLNNIKKNLLRPKKTKADKCDPSPPQYKGLVRTSVYGGLILLTKPNFESICLKFVPLSFSCVPRQKSAG